MTIRAMKNAEAAARRFLKAVKGVEERRAAAHSFISPNIYGSRESGELRRSSMDLTRALADLRAGR